MKQHRLELADVFRTHQHDFLARWNSVLSRQQRKALRDIRDCRTAVLGGHLYECDRCGHRVKVFNSCRNRTAPSARPRPAPSGSPNGRRSFCPFLISTSCSLFRSRSAAWRFRTRDRSTPSCFRPPPKLCSPSPPTPDTSAPPSASLPCCTPGVRTCISIRTCIASCPAAASPPMAPAGSPAGRTPSSFLIRFSAVGSANCSCYPWEKRFAKAAPLLRRTSRSGQAGRVPGPV